MPVSVKHSQLIYDSLKGIGVRLVSALPERRALPSQLQATAHELSLIPGSLNVPVNVAGTNTSGPESDVVPLKGLNRAFVVQGLFFAASPTGGEGFTAQRFMAARNEFHAQVGQLFNTILTLIVRVCGSTVSAMRVTRPRNISFG